MFSNFQLAAILGSGEQTWPLRIPMHQSLQNTLKEDWHKQYRDFIEGTDEVEFDAGYNPEEHERFRLSALESPNWLTTETSQSIPQLESVNAQGTSLAAIRAVAAFVKLDGNELILFQNFTRSHVIRPGRFLFLCKDTYETHDRPGLTLDSKLAAVYFSQDRKLVFQSFRTVNTFLPLAAFYREASEQDIRDFLHSHAQLTTTDLAATASLGAQQWFRKRFAMLRDSGILDNYTPDQILAQSQGYDVDVQLQNGKIVFPSERSEAKRLLQFLNEELFRGAITDTLYETNSKRESD